VLGYDVGKNLAPAVRYLAEDMGLGREGAAKLITTLPQVLGLSVEDNITPKVRYLAEELGLGKDGAAKLIARCPQVLSYSVDDNIALKVRFLAEVAGTGREGAAEIILARPALLRLSIDRNLRPTLRFVEDNFPDTSLAVTMSLATHSLAGRLVPRVRLLQRWGCADLTEIKGVESACISVLETSLEHKCDGLLSSYAFNFNLCRYTEVRPGMTVSRLKHGPVHQ